MTLPLGYRYGALYAGIRKSEQDDLALIVSDQPAQAAAVFTRNVVKAAPVRLSQRNLKASGGKVSAILINAGNANCATRTGDKVARTSTGEVAKALGLKAQFVLPASTGVIGVELDPKFFVDTIPRLVMNLAPHNFNKVAAAMMTTDTRMKLAFETVKLEDGEIQIAGMTKGAGMIQPNMATTLGFIMTDAALTANDLRNMLYVGTRHSYNELTVDGDMSTNDMLAILANGAAGIRTRRRDYEVITESVCRVMEDLARQIAADGEGARKLITVYVEGFRGEDDARRIARAIANSPLVKTAIGGSDPNWGRILSAAGSAEVDFAPEAIDISLNGVPVCSAGLALAFDEERLKKLLDAAEIEIRLQHRKNGRGQARYFTCDLTEGYVQINGSYRT